MKTKNVTFSIPVELLNKLQTLVPARGMSRFVAKLLEKGIEEEISTLKKAYLQANSDKNRNETLKDWEAVEHEDWE